MVWALVPLLLAGFVIVAFRFSSAAKARNGAKAEVQSFSAIASELEFQGNQIQDLLKRQASRYTEQIRTLRLRNISIDEIRKHKSGLRIQALKDSRLNTMADIQDWSVNQVESIRGVGSKSAGSIVAIVREVCSKSNALPMPHPSIPFTPEYENDLIVAIYRQRWFDSAIGSNRASLSRQIDTLEERLTGVTKKCAFGPWLSSLIGNADRVEEGIREAYQICADLETSAEAMTLHRQLEVSLSECRKLCSVQLDKPLLIDDFTKNNSYYKAALDKLIGPPGEALKPRPQPPPVQTVQAASEPVSISLTVTTKASIGRPIPTPSANVGHGFSGQNCWIPPGTDVDVKGYQIKGGMLYVGRELPAVKEYAGVEPALIDPSLRIEKQINSQAELSYWPRYSEISPAARGAYLYWLSTGKCDPEASIGLVFIYFYGLERRVVTFSSFDPQLNSEIAPIESEIRRLLEIYGHSNSIKQYALSLLDFMAAKRADQWTIDTLTPPPPRNHWRIPAELQIGLGSFAKDKLPLPADWALSWYLSNNYSVPAYVDCPELFTALFKQEYEKQLGKGIVLSGRSSHITIYHKPASMGLNAVSVALNLPDVTTSGSALDKLREIGRDCNKLLGPYRRFVQAQPNKKTTFDAVSMLPSTLWPDNFTKHFEGFHEAISSDGGAKVTSIRELFTSWPIDTALNKKGMALFSLGISRLGLGIEPDVRFGVSAPGPDDRIVLFAADGLSEDGSFSEGYGSASLLVHLATLVAAASNGFSDVEANVILNYLNAELDLPAPERARLAARMALYRVCPPTGAGLKKRVEQLDISAREVIGEFLVQVALADGIVDPEEVRVLESLFKMIGLEKSTLYSKVHSLQTDSRSLKQFASAPTTIHIDPAKLAALKSESARISVILGDVFDESVAPSKTEPPIEDEKEESEIDESALLGLDPQHSSLLEALLQRPQWTRAEVEDVCADRNMMIDGAIERINDAAFNEFDCAILDGDDPIDVNCDLLSKEMA